MLIRLATGRHSRDVTAPGGRFSHALLRRSSDKVAIRSRNRLAVKIWARKFTRKLGKILLLCWSVDGVGAEEQRKQSFNDKSSTYGLLNQCDLTWPNVAYLAWFYESVVILSIWQYFDPTYLGKTFYAIEHITLLLENVPERSQKFNYIKVA